MRVTILDLDWFNNVSHVPNPICMKLSSYYKQLGYAVNFPTKKFELGLDHDILYVVRESMWGKVPDEINISDSRTNLIGNAFKFFKRAATIPDVVMSCRPDYLLYDLPLGNRLASSNIVTFYGTRGKRLQAMQDYHSTYEKRKDTVVADDDFWSKDIKDVRYCVHQLRHEENIVFSKPISLKSLIEDEERLQLFFSLKLKRNVGCFFKSDWSSYDNNAIFKFLHDVRENFGTYPFQTPEFPMYDKTKSDIDNIRNAMVLAKQAKEMQAKIILKAPARTECALWSYYEDFEAWSRNAFTLSYVEYLARIQGYIGKLDPVIVLENEIHWSIAQMQNMADIMFRDPTIIEDYGFIEWGDKYYPFVDLRKVLRIKEKF